MRFLIMTVAALFVTAGGAQAAVLSDISGRVAINTGGGFQTVGGVVEVAPGTLVMAAPGARAKIVYGQSCEVHVRPGRVYTVAEDHTCAAGRYDTGGGSLKDGGAVAGGDAGGFAAGGAAAGVFTPTTVVLGIFAGGIVAGAIASAADGPSSP